jgi:hypothetical protein
MELETVHNDIIELVDNWLLTEAVSGESKMFYFTLKCSYDELLAYAPRCNMTLLNFDVGRLTPTGSSPRVLYMTNKKGTPIMLLRPIKKRKKVPSYT